MSKNVHDLKRKAERAAEKIIYDLTCHETLLDAWWKIHEDLREEITGMWARMIQEEFEQ